MTLQRLSTRTHTQQREREREKKDSNNTTSFLLSSFIEVEKRERGAQRKQPVIYKKNSQKNKG